MNRRDFLKFSALVPVLVKIGAIVTYETEVPTLAGYVPLMREGKVRTLSITREFMRGVMARFRERTAEKFAVPIIDAHHYPGVSPNQVGVISDMKMNNGILYGKPEVKNIGVMEKGEYLLSCEVLADRQEVVAVALVQQDLVFPEFPKIEIGAEMAV